VLQGFRDDDVESENAKVCLSLGYGGMDTNLNAFETSALDGGDYKASRSGYLIPRERVLIPRYPLDYMAPKLVSTH
jgi:hypothetical protein